VPGQLTLRPPALWLSHFALCPIVDHARVTVMTFSSPPSLPLSRPWAGVSAWQLVRPPPSAWGSSVPSPFT